MTKNIDNFIKSKDFIICIDSDGSAIDTMNIKHNECFGPCLVKEFNLENHSEKVLKEWAKINLFSLTRGVNRFKTQYYLLQFVDDNLQKIDDLQSLKNWVENSKELSNSSLKNEIEKTNSEILKKTLAWSLAVNEAIEKLPSEVKKAYEGVREFLEHAKKYADIAIVSSANYEALLSEWQEEKLMPYVDVIMSQNEGSKAFCIGELIKKGYERQNVLMVGDAPGDLSSADENNVYFYPILVNDEVQSWQEFKENALSKFLNNDYKEYNDKAKEIFLKNLSV